jgi:histidinol-phosphatase (PHP family)
MTLATYHNHSRWSDGKATIEELIAAARSMGIDELGISDHWVLHPSGTQFKWAMRTDRLPEYVSELKQMREQAKPHAAVALRIGLEVDWHPGRAAPLRAVLEQYPFDYIIGSVHEVQLPDSPFELGGFMIDGSPAAWEKISIDQRNDLYLRYWRNIKSLAESGVFDIVAHIDLPKKFAFYPTIDLSREIADALDAISAAQTTSGGKLVVEMNTAGWHKPCADGYPTLDILKQCNRREIPVTISADAHQPEHLLRDFVKAAQRLSAAGYTAIARFANRETRFEPLTDAVVARCI